MSLLLLFLTPAAEEAAAVTLDTIKIVLYIAQKRAIAVQG